MSIGFTERGRVFATLAIVLLTWANQGRARQDAPSEPDSVETQRVMRALLADELTSRWYPRAIDREHGGFHQNFARDWSPRPDSDKFLVYQARMT